MASPAQDVWSFGAMAYELMAAEPVFASDRADDNLTTTRYNARPTLRRGGKPADGSNSRAARHADRAPRYC